MAVLENDGAECLVLELADRGDVVVVADGLDFCHALEEQVDLVVPVVADDRGDPNGQFIVVEPYGVIYAQGGVGGHGEPTVLIAFLGSLLGEDVLVYYLGGMDGRCLRWRGGGSPQAVFAMRIRAVMATMVVRRM